MRPNLLPVEFVLGPNWVVTAHREEVPVLEEFLERAEGGGQVGGLDAPSFVAAICEWVIARLPARFRGGGGRARGVGREGQVCLRRPGCSGRSLG
jgi:hypothetical protein